jgi:N-acetylglucosamine-6-phosphate deacetylase
MQNLYQLYPIKLTLKAVFNTFTAVFLRQKMEKKVIKGRVFSGFDVIEDGYLVIEKGIVTDLTATVCGIGSYEFTDCSGLNISPGFIDLQIAGAGGYLYSSYLTHDALEKISESIVSTGTTGFLIVLPTNSEEVYRKAAENVASFNHPALLGLHLEGPFINQLKRGAHAPGYILKPENHSPLVLPGLKSGTVKMLTLAPELFENELLTAICESGVVVCAGHSNATFEEAVSGFDCGIKGVTHLYNAMSAFHHREPGLPGAAFLDNRVMASIVADGIHVSWEALRVAKAVMGERLYLVSDAVEESTEGACHHVRQKDRFTLPDGTLSGSALTMMKAVENCVRHAGIDMAEALRMASLYPARLMGLKNTGTLQKGMRANITCFDNDFNVRLVMIDGKTVKQ